MSGSYECYILDKVCEMKLEVITWQFALQKFYWLENCMLWLTWIEIRSQLCWSAFLCLSQVLKLSNAALASTTTGNIVNLVSSDTQKFDWVCSMSVMWCWMLFMMYYVMCAFHFPSEGLFLSPLPGPWSFRSCCCTWTTVERDWCIIIGWDGSPVCHGTHAD